MNVNSTSYSHAVGFEQPSGGTLAHHEDITPEPAATLRTSLQKVKTDLDTAHKTLTLISEAVEFRQDPSSAIESYFKEGYRTILFRYMPSYKDRLQTLQLDLSTLGPEIERITKLARVLPEDSELVLCLPKCEWYTVRLQMLKDATSKRLALVNEKLFKEALKVRYDIAYECGIIAQASIELKEKAEKFKELCLKATRSITEQLEAAAGIRITTEVKAAITKVQLDTLKSVKQLHDTIKNASPDGESATITTSLAPAEKKRAECIARITSGVVQPLVQPLAQPQNPPGIFTDDEIKSFTPKTDLVGAMYFDEGVYARRIKNPSVATVTAGKALYEKAKAIDSLRKQVLDGIKKVCRGVAITQHDYDKYLATLYQNVATLEADLLKDATNYLSQYVLDYAAGLQSLLKGVEGDLQYLTMLNNPNYRQMHDVQTAVSAFLQPQMQSSRVELLYEAVTRRDKAKSTFNGKPVDEGEIRFRAKIENFHEVLAAKSKAALALTPSEETVPFRLFGIESFDVVGKLHDDVRLYLEKEIMKLLYRPDKTAPMVVDNRLEQLLHLVRTHKKYKELFQKALTEYPRFKAMVDAYDKEVVASRAPEKLLTAVNKIEHFLYRASSNEGLDPIVHFARGWQRFVQRNFQGFPDVKKFIADELQRVCDTFGYIKVSEADVEKKLQVTAQMEGFKNTLETSVALTKADKQATLFRALACAIESRPATHGDEYIAAQKVIGDYTEGGKIADYIEGHEDHFYTLIYENTIQKIMRDRLNEVGDKEKELLLQGPIQSYLSAFTQDVTVDVLESAGRLDRVLFRLAFDDQELVKKIKNERFKGSDDRYAEWYRECEVYENAVQGRLL